MLFPFLPKISRLKNVTSVDQEKLWHQVLKRLAEKVDPGSFKGWLKPTIPLSIKNDQLTIGFPHAYARDTVEKRYYPLIKEAVDQIKGGDNKIVFVVSPTHFEKKTEDRAFGPLFDKEPILASPPDIRLRSDFTFANFAVSPTNELAYAAATAVAKSPGQAYNPLFLYGGVGVGKTHLMQAIGHEVLENHAGLKLIYCMGEEFTNEIIAAIQTKTTRKFKEKYRSAKVLLIDDIQFIAGKTTVQEEFFHTFDAVQREGGQVVLTSDKPPGEIADLEDRLRSRFEGGLIIDIQQPNFELRTAILLIKAKQQNLNLPIDLAKLIAANIESTRRLEGVLARLKTEATLKNIPITQDLVSQVLGQDKDKLPKRRVKPQEVVRAVARFYKLKMADLKGSKRKKNIVNPRHVLMYLLRVDLGLPLVEIGQIFGGRHHTTVMHAVDKITGRLSTSEKLRSEISLIKQDLFH